LTRLHEECSETSGSDGTNSSLEAHGGASDLERACGCSTGWSNRSLCCANYSTRKRRWVGNDWASDWHSLSSGRKRVGLTANFESRALWTVGRQVRDSLPDRGRLVGLGSSADWNSGVLNWWWRNNPSRCRRRRACCRQSQGAGTFGDGQGGRLDGQIYSSTLNEGPYLGDRVSLGALGKGSWRRAHGRIDISSHNGRGPNGRRNDGGNILNRRHLSGDWRGRRSPGWVALE
jgi:hypothetical protein